MSLDSAAWVTQLDSNNPTVTDPVNQGDDHLKMIKLVLKNSFPSTSTSAIVPSMSGQTGKFLTNDGTDASWGSPAAGDPAGTAVAMAIALG